MTRIRRIEQGLHSDAPLWSQASAAATLVERMAHYAVPGVSVAVFSNGSIEWAQGYGVLEAGRSAAVTPETVFQACSISKHVAAVGVLRLVQQGLIDLDTDVNHYLRSWRLPSNGDWQPRVTSRQLLGHTAGLSYNWYRGFERGMPLPTLLQVLNGQPPANTPPVRVVIIPGTRNRYSGSHYSVIQQLMIDVTAMPFPALMQELVFDPLEMHHSSYDQAYPDDQSKSVAVGHYLGGVPVRGKWRVIPEMAGAGLWTTPTDLARLEMALQKAYAGATSSFLSQSLVQQAFTPQLNPEYGLGTQLWGVQPPRCFGHSGDNIGYKCQSKAFVESGSGVVIMTNGDDGHSVIEELMQVVWREYGWPADEVRREMIAVTPSQLDGYVGTYELEAGFSVTVRREGTELMLQVPTQPPIPLQSAGSDVFFSTAVNSSVRFIRAATGAETGTVVGLIIKQEGQESHGSKDH
jgi:CubicO group peptidase (beta-lactamase class C family)